MPKQNFIKVQLASERYDRCQDCPFCGLIPENQRQIEGVKYVCLGTMKSLRPSDFEGRSKKRHCDEIWRKWMELPKREFWLSQERYTQFRLPYEQTLKTE